MELNVEKQSRKESDQRALKKVEEKVQVVRVDVAVEEKERIEQIEKQHKIISDQLGDFQKELNEERRIR